MGAHRQRAAREGRRTAAQCYWPTHSSSIHAELHGPCGQSCPYSRSYRRREGHRLQIGRRIQRAGYGRRRARSYTGCDQVNRLCRRRRIQRRVRLHRRSGQRSYLDRLKINGDAAVCAGGESLRTAGRQKFRAGGGCVKRETGADIRIVAARRRRNRQRRIADVRNNRCLRIIRRVGCPHHRRASDTSAQTGSHPPCGCDCCRSPR